MLLPSRTQLIGAAIGITASFSAGWYVNGLVWEKRAKSLVDAKESEITQKCDKDKKITEDANAFYQAETNAIAGKLNKYRLLMSKCVAISSDPSVIPASGREPARPNGLTVDFVRRIAAQGDEYRAQRMTCDKYFEGLK